MREHADLPTCGGITTGAEATAVADTDETTRGPDGSSESNPLPSARRFSAGLCSSIAAINLSFSLYIVLRYIFIPNKTCHPSAVDSFTKRTKLKKRATRCSVAALPNGESSSLQVHRHQLVA